MNGPNNILNFQSYTRNATQAMFFHSTHLGAKRGIGKVWDGIGTKMLVQVHEQIKPT